MSSLSYPSQTAVPRRMIRDMATEDQPLARASSYGTPSLSTAELLALVLQTPDALDLAQEMLSQAGNLHALYQSDLPQIQRLHGVGVAKAIQVKAALELGRRSMKPVNLKGTKVTSPADAANILWADMVALKQEQFRVIMLDTRNRIIAIETIYQGSVNTIVIRTSEIFRPAIVKGAVAIIVAHNHPSGEASPSPEDISITRSIASVGKQLSIDLLDHVVIASSGFVSLKERGLGFD